MDLLKEEKRLIEKKHKALENLGKKKKYLETAAKSFRKAKREFKLAAIELNAIRKQIKAEGIQRPAEPEAITEPKPITEESKGE